MKPDRPAVIVVGAALALGAAALGPAKAGEVTVHIRDLKSSSGQVGCALFANERGFPRDTIHAFAKMFRPIRGASSSCVFENLTAGTYAVIVFHDANGDGVLNTNLIGGPMEGYGASNNHTYALSPPRWGESAFNLRADESKTLEINLRY